MTHLHISILGAIILMHSVLYDLSLAHVSAGYSGIPQDTRLLFAALSGSKQIDLSGLIRPSGMSYLLNDDLNSFQGQSIFLGPFLDKRIVQTNLAYKALYKWLPEHVIRCVRILLRSKSMGNLYPVHADKFSDMIWRQFFALTVEPRRKELLMNSRYFLNMTGGDRITLTTSFNLPPQRINTQGFDFLITQDTRPLRLSKGTVPIARYHDGIPIFASDTTHGTNQLTQKNHVGGVSASQENTVFVCNSSASLEDLAAIAPKRAENAYVIPCLIPKMSRKNTTLNQCKGIAKQRISLSTLPRERDASTNIINKWFSARTTDNKPPKYIMCLATIEPRKNFVGLIRAWSRLRLETSENIKLLLVGSPGWNFETILESIRPFVEKGELLHLEKVDQEELPYLYSSASCFVFASFVEGFGLPIAEAMQCGCPVICSDIPSHRYAAGDAAIFFNPYDIEDIALKISSIVSPSATDLTRMYIEKGYENVKRFSVESVLPQWEALFNEIKLKK